MIINIYDITQNLFFVRCLDTDTKLFIGAFEECKKFQFDYNLKNILR